MDDMKKRYIMIFAVLLAFLAASLAGAADTAAKGKPQTVCPVMAGDINKDLYTDYKGQRVYFCCPACVELFKKEPEKYLQKMKEQGVTPEKAPAGK
jgi:YHS domain-containing protein